MGKNDVPGITKIHFTASGGEKDIKMAAALPIQKESPKKGGSRLLEEGIKDRKRMRNGGQIDLTPSPFINSNSCTLRIILFSIMALLKDCSGTVEPGLDPRFKVRTCLGIHFQPGRNFLKKQI